MGSHRGNYGQSSVTQRRDTAIREYQVTCIEKSQDSSAVLNEILTDDGKADRPRAHFNITRLGGPGWTLSKEEVVFMLISEQANFFTEDPATGERAYLVPVDAGQGDLYVQTKPDDTLTNNLLALDPCR